MEIHSVRRAIRIVGSKDPHARLGVQLLHPLLVHVAFVTQLFGLCAVALGVGLLGRLKCIRHLVPLGSGLVTQLLVVRILGILVVIVKQVDIRGP